MCECPVTFFMLDSLICRVLSFEFFVDVFQLGRQHAKSDSNDYQADACNSEYGHDTYAHRIDKYKYRQ